MSAQQGLEAVVDQALERLGQRIVMGLPLGLGKPNRLINAFYRRAKEDRSIRLDIVTALSLDVPQSGHWLQSRLMSPIVERLFGSDYPRLDYLKDLAAGQVPENITVSEFYFQSGAALGNADLQRRYIASNYTHVARDLCDRGVNLIAQLISAPVDGRYSLSCNPDVTLDLTRLFAGLTRDTMTVGQVHPNLPFMHGDAVVEPDFFDLIVEEDPGQTLVALPRTPVSLQDYAVGFHASRLVADGGTLQIGIGSLSDALVHALILRHNENARYLEFAGALDAPVPAGIGDDKLFEHGLYGASEMFMDAFMHLYRAGILKREVFDDLELQRRTNAGELHERSGTGAVMDGGFFLGSQDFYDFLRQLDASERPRFRMHGVGRVNQLYGGSEPLEVAQRRNARFINSCMMVTATGAAVSDALADQQVVSGVGGQYNFVAMAHAMTDGRSVLMLRAVREKGNKRSSNIVWEYPHTTIPRHLRDLVATEYGVADLRGRTDEECIQAMVGIMDADFQDALVDQAKRAGKLARAWRPPDDARRNTPDHIRRTLGKHRARHFPEYPFGSDFTPVEQRLIPAMMRLERISASKWALLRALLTGRPSDFPQELARLNLSAPETLRERVHARLVACALKGS
jgi:acyl-CoA hydrolase